ncbi:MAG: amidase [Candidatus Neomarinimicrobiota bacterium]
MKKYLILLLCSSALLLESCVDSDGISINNVSSAENLTGLEFTAEERDSLLDGLTELKTKYEELRELSFPNNITYPLYFIPGPAGTRADNQSSKIHYSKQELKRPEKLEDMAFFSVGQLGELLRTKQVTSLELTKMYLERLKRFGSNLECVVTLTEKRALEQARQADREIAEGLYRGPLHGIPYGAKDLLSISGYGTTWGAEPFKDQVIEETAEVIKRLDRAGAICVAKLTLGALAWGDVWFGGKTRNPWNLEQGSSGSSAGPAAATAAGLVAFAIGSETWGSIVSPSTRCGVTGFRPSFGTVSRTGAMALSWSMDKLGPICRTVEDCAMVYDVIRGPDHVDLSVMDVPFSYNPKVDLDKIKIGYIKSAFEDTSTSQNDRDVLSIFAAMGVNLIPLELPEFPTSALSFVLSAEAAAAFDELTRSNRDDELVRQIKNAWPNEFRTARFIPAVEYIQANRARSILNRRMAALMDQVDVYICPSFWGDNLLRTNLSGHPCVVLPNGFNAQGSPTSISFIGKLYGEGTLLAAAKVYQDATNWHLQYPEEFLPHK